jgi:hypothetical protein
MITESLFAILSPDQCARPSGVAAGFAGERLTLSSKMESSKIDGETYKRIHVEGNLAINGSAPDPFAVVMGRLGNGAVQEEP